MNKAVRTIGELFSLAYERILIPQIGVALSDFPNFSRLVGGLRPREFTIVCGSTGTGKTTWLANMSACLLKQGTKHFVASVETGDIDYAVRVMSALAGTDFNTGEAVEIERVKDFQNKYGALVEGDNLILSIYEDRTPVEDMLAAIESARLMGAKVAFIDNLNFFMEVTSANNQVAEMDRVVHEFIIYCKKHDIHVVMIMHPRKTAFGARVESEFDIKGSSTAVQEAHNIFLLNRPHPELIEQNLATSDDRELRIQKLRRRGKSVGQTIILKSLTGADYSEKAVINWLPSKN